MFSYVGRLLSRDALELAPAQKYMYDHESLGNFRVISRIVATRSRYVLTSKDAAPSELQRELAELGHFSELAYNVMPVEMVYSNLELLTQPGFPLEDAEVIKDSQLLQSFVGSVANLPGFTAYRSARKQLVVAISGTRTLKHVAYDFRNQMTRHPACKKCLVHKGFWKLYLGLKAPVMTAIRDALMEKAGEIEELAITGHSMGGAMSYLLALDLLLEKEILLPGLRIKLAVFGSPRVGNKRLARVWRKAVDDYRMEYGQEALLEYSVKIYNDGATSLPPHSWKYRHFTKTPLYHYGSRLYRVPSSECEHGVFRVSVGEEEERRRLQFPRGGHGYYNDRDMESFANRLSWIAEHMGEEGWKERYLEQVKAREELAEAQAVTKKRWKAIARPIVRRPSGSETTKVDDARQ
ncbi:alpha/beta-hydrolase [Heliocybe sulcata]|uniref:Alpha/beta-hydrolase n=1 Tax=Heliocybe sulcata TaxID=5364 RepID=A0A5C3NM89_9AGAM|nr:alpha/beta-hydrolase [Heliocybe sulcata]